MRKRGVACRPARARSDRRMPHCESDRCTNTISMVEDVHFCMCGCDDCKEAEEEDRDRKKRAKRFAEDARMMREAQLEAAPPAASPARSGSGTWLLGLVLAAVAAGWFYNQSQPNASPAATVPAKTGAPETKQEYSKPAAKTDDDDIPLETRIAKMGLEDAVAWIHPDMKNTVGDLSAADRVLARWAAAHMKWSELQTIDETKPGEAMKDPYRWRGNRVCGSGRILQIEAAQLATGKVFEGVLDSEADMRFVAAGDTGELVAGSEARFCGIMTGTNTYQTPIGGTNKALMVVGMFDLPTNRRK